MNSVEQVLGLVDQKISGLDIIHSGNQSRSVYILTSIESVIESGVEVEELLFGLLSYKEVVVC